MPKIKDISGQKFGRLTAIKRIGSNKYGNSIWFCQCQCGDKTEALLSSLQDGNTRSCGCLHHDKLMERNWKHGAGRKKDRPRLYSIWANMKSRCYNPEASGYEYYGGRGISICEEWEDFRNFRKWAKANGYQDGLEIDRIDNDGDYCPENCHWVTPQEQANNKRTNYLITFQGRTKTLAEWSDITGFNYKTLYSRLKLYDWPVKKALTEPINKN